MQKIFENYDKIESARDAGMMSINVSEKEYMTFEDRAAASDFKSMIPRASRRTNTHYSIDDLLVIACDIDVAMDRAITPLAKTRLLRHYNEGYTLEEVGQQDGVSKQSVDESIKSAIHRIAEYLEKPKVAKKVPAYQFERNTQGRTYSAPPYWVPPQR